MKSDNAYASLRQQTPASEMRQWKRAALWLAVLGPFFFMSYGFANWWTGRLSDVESMMFSWEKYIPFLPWTILPYMSIDAFYAASLFLCSSRVELDIHAKRVFSATLISVVGFLLLPLKFGLERPVTSGFNGALFDVLTGFDKPFNQAPSLHISLLLLLWLVYARHLRGTTRWVMHSWFVLIGISVFTTFQHHLIDGVSGAIVGVICVYLFPDPPHQWSVKHSTDRQSGRLARRYLLASMLFFGLALLLQGWGWVLLWPGSALLLVALAYGHFGIAIFQKNNGHLSWPAQVLLYPYQIGAWFSSRWFTKNLLPSAEVVRGIWIGRAPGRSDWQHLFACARLDLTVEFQTHNFPEECQHINVPMLDLIAPSQLQLLHAVDALDALRQLHKDKPVLVHCALGFSRSALVIAAWLMRNKLAATPHEALALIRAARPQIVFKENYQNALHQFQHYDARSVK